MGSTKAKLIFRAEYIGVPARQHDRGCKTLRRQHSQANQKYHHRHPQSPVVLILVKRIASKFSFLFIGVELGNAESKPLDLAKKAGP